MFFCFFQMSPFSPLCWLSHPSYLVFRKNRAIPPWLTTVLQTTDDGALAPNGPSVAQTQWKFNLKMAPSNHLMDSWATPFSPSSSHLQPKYSTRIAQKMQTSANVLLSGKHNPLCPNDHVPRFSKINYSWHMLGDQIDGC